MPVWRINDNRQIEAELQHNFHLLACCPPKLLDRSSPSQYSGISIMHTQGVTAFRFRTPEQRVKVVDFDVCQNSKKINWLPQQRPFGYCKTCQFCNPHTCDYLCWKADADWSSSCWDIRSDMPILPSRPTRCISLERLRIENSIFVHWFAMWWFCIEISNCLFSGRSHSHVTSLNLGK